MDTLILLVVILTYPYFCFCLGISVLAGISRNKKQNLPPRYYILIGLLVSNYFFYLLKYLGLGWGWAACFAWAIPLAITFKKISFQQIRRFKFSYNLIAFSLINCIIATSLFDLDNGITTLWMNNYGDLPYHIGMITSFVWGENFPPQHHLLAGHPLSYPLIINFWSASFWWINPSWMALKLIFVYQWIFITTLLYGFIRGNKFKFMPWVILFGGGVYLRWGGHTNDFIHAGLPWVGFLDAIWVTQRSALLGTMCFVAIAPLLLQILIRKRVVKNQLYFICLVILCLPLVHTHTWIISFCCAISVLLITIIQSPNKLTQLRVLLFPILLLISSIALIISLEDKTSAIALMSGWLSGEESKYWFNSTSLAEFGKNPILLKIIFWIANAWTAILIFLILCFKSKSWKLSLFVVVLGILYALLNVSEHHFQLQLLISGILGVFLIFMQTQVSAQTQILSLILISFFLGNIIKLSFWDFDQIKIFIPIYLLLIVAWQALISSKSKLNFLFIILLIPGTYRSMMILVNQNYSTVYTNQQMEESKFIRKKVPPTAIIAANPTHNSLISLTGRKMYMGYIATLWTHGFDYRKQKIVLENIIQEPCKEEICPDYLYGDNSFDMKKLDTDRFTSLGSALYKINDLNDK